MWIWAAIMALSEAAMVLPFVILSILCGLFAALGVVLAGGGFWFACLAYAGTGALVLALVFVWVALCAPAEGRVAPVPRRAPEIG